MPGHTDHLLGGNIRRDNRDPDQRPSQPAPGKEEIRAILLVAFRLAAFPDTESDNENEKSNKYKEVLGRDVHRIFNGFLEDYGILTRIRHGKSKEMHEHSSDFSVS